MSISVEASATLLSRDLKRNLFNLFSSWSGPFAKPLRQNNSGSSGGSSTNVEEEKLQFCALQAQSAILSCGPFFDGHYLAEDGILYSWLDLLLNTTDDKVYELARDTVVLLLECNPDQGQLLEWVIDRCYTASARQADACFLALATIFCARFEHFCGVSISMVINCLIFTGNIRVITTHPLSTLRC